MIKESVRKIRILERVNENLPKYRFNDIANLLYNHTWKVFCDWYVDFSKALLNSGDPKFIRAHVDDKEAFLKQDRPENQKGVYILMDASQVYS